jgi:hypothetical protein
MTTTLTQMDEIPSGITTKVCKRCGHDFKPTGTRQRVCNNCRLSNKNGTRANRRTNHQLRFIGVDGEGVDRPDGKQDYVMLSIGDDTLTNPDGSELKTDQIFSHLWNHFINNHKDGESATYIGFYLSYDFTQWTKHLPADPAYWLWSKEGQTKRKPVRSKNPDPFPVYWNGWEFDVLTKRRFRLRKHTHKPTKKDPDICRCGSAYEAAEPNDKSEDPDITSMGDIFTSNSDFKNMWKQFATYRRSDAWMYICDTGSFWQMSFIKVLETFPPDFFTDEEKEVIKHGKAARGMEVVEYGDISTYEEMGRYNRMENALLAKVTAHLNEGFTAVGIKIPGRNWYGPGQAAQLWMDTQSKKLAEGATVTRLDLEASVPLYAREAGRMSYYGGWFEITHHGHIGGTVWNYDINSAYPTITKDLPCLHHGTWTEGINLNDIASAPDTDLVLLECTVHGSNEFLGAMPYRTKDGRILRPHHTRGWYWAKELNAARKATLIDSIDIHSYVRYQPCDCPPPYREIENLYLERTRVVNGISVKDTAKGKALKLVYNSTYGKNAQSVGNPKFSSPIYASLITSGCRTTILNAISEVGADAVTMVATDGVYFTRPWHGCSISKRLGEWDETILTGLTQFMPGLYWYEGSGDYSAKTRGINVNDLKKAIRLLNEEFTRFRISVANGDDAAWPSLDIPIKFDFTSATQAVARHRWETAGRVARDNPIRTIKSIPVMKREVVPYIDTYGVRTPVPEYGPNGIESTPYSAQFGMELAESLDSLRIENPDGDILSQFKWLVNDEA